MNRQEPGPFTDIGGVKADPYNAGNAGGGRPAIPPGLSMLQQRWAGQEGGREMPGGLANVLGRYTDPMAQGQPMYQADAGFAVPVPGDYHAGFGVPIPRGTPSPADALYGGAPRTATAEPMSGVNYFNRTRGAY